MLDSRARKVGPYRTDGLAVWAFRNHTLRLADQPANPATATTQHTNRTANRLCACTSDTSVLICMCGSPVHFVQLSNCNAFHTQRWRAKLQVTLYHTQAPTQQTTAVVAFALLCRRQLERPQSREQGKHTGHTQFILSAQESTSFTTLPPTAVLLCFFPARYITQTCPAPLPIATVGTTQPHE
jgi:hypothetical protein